MFGALALFGAVLWVVVWRRMPETLPRERRRVGGLRPALAGYRKLVRDRHFVALAILPGLGVAVLMATSSASPFVLREGYGLVVAPVLAAVRRQRRRPGRSGRR